MTIFTRRLKNVNFFNSVFFDFDKTNIITIWPCEDGTWRTFWPTLTVKDGAHYTGAQLHRQGFPGPQYRISHGNTS